MSAKLTPKQEAFALAYVETGNASEAYRRSYDVGETTTPQVVWNEASLLLANREVAVRIMELQSAARERTLVTVESITSELEAIRGKALGADQYAPAVSAVMGKAKVNGLLVDKADVTQKTTVEFVAKEQRDAAVAAFARSDT